MALNRHLSRMDFILTEVQHALNTTVGINRAQRNNPAKLEKAAELTDEQTRHSAGLMRINHTGEVCAQALYLGQARVAKNETTKQHLLHAAAEETDHLAWCENRLAELNARPSVFNPLWYLGSYSIGVLAGLKSDALSLGFVAETERQVEAHLAQHLESLPHVDAQSRAILLAMKADEARHAEQAEQQGGQPLPEPIPQAMALSARLMKYVAYRL